MYNNVMSLFVPFEVAQLADKAGFTQGCIAWFEPDTKIFHVLGQEPDIDYPNQWHTTFKTPEIIQAPMYPQLIKWLFDQGLNLHHSWLPCEQKWGCDIYAVEGDLLWSDHAAGIGGKFDTLEEAWTVAITKAIEFVLKF